MINYQYTMSGEVITELELMNNADSEEIQEMIEEGEIVKVEQWPDGSWFAV